jgi:hypothetical protein
MTSLSSYSQSFPGLPSGGMGRFFLFCRIIKKCIEDNVSSSFWDYFGRFSVKIPGVICFADITPEILSRKLAQKNPKIGRTCLSRHLLKCRKVKKFRHQKGMLAITSLFYFPSLLLYFYNQRVLNVAL